jgi:hypothetical protein
MLRKCRSTAASATRIAAPGNVKRCCSGHMIPGIYRYLLYETLQPTEANIAILRESALIPVAEPYL